MNNLRNMYKRPYFWLILLGVALVAASLGIVQEGGGCGEGSISILDEKNISSRENISLVSKEAPADAITTLKLMISAPEDAKAIICYTGTDACTEEFTIGATSETQISLNKNASIDWYAWTPATALKDEDHSREGSGSNIDISDAASLYFMLFVIDSDGALIIPSIKVNSLSISKSIHPDWTDYLHIDINTNATSCDVNIDSLLPSPIHCTTEADSCKVDLPLKELNDAGYPKTGEGKLEITATKDTSPPVPFIYNFNAPDYLAENGLALYYDFEEIQTYNEKYFSKDLSGYGQNGELSNTNYPTSEPTPCFICENGIDNKFANFDGTNDFISISDDSVPDATKDISVEAWIKTNYQGLAMQTIFTNKTGTESNGFLVYYMYDDNLKRGQICYEYKNGANEYKACSLPGIRLGLWNHVATVYKSATQSVDFYINGKLRNSVAGFNDAGINTENQMAGMFNNLYFSGAIDELKVYYKAKTPDELCNDVNGQWNSGVCHTGELMNCPSGSYYFIPIIPILGEAICKFDNLDVPAISQEYCSNEKPPYLGFSWDEAQPSYFCPDGFVKTNCDGKDCCKLSLQPELKYNQTSCNITSDLMNIDFRWNECPKELDENLGCNNIDITQSDLSEGTMTDVQWLTDHLELSSGKLNGSYISPFYESEAPFTTWNPVAITKNGPYGEEIPDGLSASGNALLMHLNNNVLDSSGNNNNGTLAGDADCTIEGKLGSKSCYFDGNGDYIEIPPSPSLNLINEITVATWIKSDSLQSTTTQGIFEKIRSSDGYRAWFLSWNNDHLMLNMNFQWLQYGPPDSGDPKTIYSLGFVYTPWGSLTKDNNWHHVAFTFGSNVSNGDKYVKMYIDGQAQVVYKGSQTPCGNYCGPYPPDKHIQDNANYNLYMGTGYNTDFKGYLDEATIFNSALTADQIKNLYIRGALRSKLYVASCDSPDCTANFIGPLEGVNPLNFSTLIEPKKYFRYKLELEKDSTTTESPKISAVSFDYSW